MDGYESLVFQTAKRFGKRMTRILEVTQSEDVVLRRQLVETRELHRGNNKRRTGEQIALPVKFVPGTR